MRTINLCPALLLMVTGLPACPGDDTGDEGTNSAATTSTSTDPTTGDTTAAEAGDTTTAEGSTADTADSTSSEPVFGDIEVTVIYEGAQTGTLSAVALTEFPPMGPPSAITTNMMPMFPWVGTLSGLEAGEYIIFATLDVGNNNPTIPGAEDPQSDVIMMPVTVVVDGAGPFKAEVTLVDPM